MTTEMPWVAETRLAPGQRLKRSPVFGILAAVGAGIGVLLFLLSMGAIFGGLFGAIILVLPVWGILTLATVGCAIAALVRRGRVNTGLGIASLSVVVLTNPLLPLIVALALGA